MPDHLAQALSSRILAYRPLLPSSLPPPEVAEQSLGSEDALVTGADQEMLEKSRNFHEKASTNVAVMPIILRRMNACIARINKLEEYNVEIYPIFNRR